MVKSNHCEPSFAANLQRGEVDELSMTEAAGPINALMRAPRRLHTNLRVVGFYPESVLPLLQFVSATVALTPLTAENYDHHACN